MPLNIFALAYIIRSLVFVTFVSVNIYKVFGSLERLLRYLRCMQLTSAVAERRLQSTKIGIGIEHSWALSLAPLHQKFLRQREIPQLILCMWDARI